jgi:exopolysaccharide biosynthesis polyprenyl glycosylphosphotransferase
MPGSARAHWVRRVVALVLGDLAALLLMLPLAVWAASVLSASEAPGLLQRPLAIAITMAAIPFLAALGLYGHRRRLSQTLTLEFSRVLLALSLFAYLSTELLHAEEGADRVFFDRELFMLWVLGVLAVTLTRGAVRRIVIPRISGRQRTVIVGAGEVGQRIARALLVDRSLGVDVVGFIDSDPQPLEGRLRKIPILGPERDLIKLVQDARAQRVIVSFSRSDPQELLDAFRRSDLHRIHVTIVPRLFEVLTSDIDLDDVNGMTLLDLRPARLSRSAFAVKRVSDLLIVLLAMPFLLPAFVAIAVAIKCGSRGPVFFRQPRSGRHGRVFRIFKFRTMVVNAEALRDDLLDHNEMSGPLFKIKDDPRVTRVGRFLRRTSLDELPQLINVLRGDMSLVGPRPFVIYEDDKITGWARRRLDLTPGITGLWQVMGRNDMPFDEMVKLDHMYVTRWSLLWDFKILLKTIPSVLRRQGAY